MGALTLAPVASALSQQDTVQDLYQICMRGKDARASISEIAGETVCTAYIAGVADMMTNIG
ncbi:MAG TPA: hypothetical protein VJ487_03125 [Alphaproteobacteria bacterium]|nr:hypothetical protein [Alphaproteobacteria bacterium]